MVIKDQDQEWKWKLLVLILGDQEEQCSSLHFLENSNEVSKKGMNFFFPLIVEIPLGQICVLWVIDKLSQKDKRELNRFIKKI